MIQTSRRTLSIALHLAAGILFGVIAVELVPRTLEGMEPWMAVLGILAGGVAFIGLDAIIDRFQSEARPQEPKARLPGRETRRAPGPSTPQLRWIFSRTVS